MPQFEFRCTPCNYRFDRIVQRWDTQVKCPLCQGKVEKLMSSFSVGQPYAKTADLPPGVGPKMCSNC